MWLLEPIFSVTTFCHLEPGLVGERSGFDEAIEFVCGVNRLLERTITWLSLLQEKYITIILKESYKKKVS